MTSLVVLIIERDSADGHHLAMPGVVLTVRNLYRNRLATRDGDDESSTNLTFLLSVSAALSCDLVCSADASRSNLTECISV